MLQCDFNKVALGVSMGVLLKICCMFSKHLWMAASKKRIKSPTKHL